MIRLKISRDQARLVDQDILPVILMVLKMKVRDAAEDTPEYYNAKVILSLINDISIAFKKKLWSSSNNFVFHFSDGHGICLYHLLMQHPMDTTIIYNVLTRQQICNSLHNQVIAYTKHYEV